MTSILMSELLQLMGELLAYVNETVALAIVSGHSHELALQCSDTNSQCLKHIDTDVRRLESERAAA